MPDNQMPYGDYDNNTPQYQQMPDPNMAFNNFSYAQNNQMLMNSGQSNMQQTMQIAQSNFAVHMQNVLQGTMAAAMAVYATGKSVVEKSREHLYGDQLLGQGVYALERSASRDIIWGTGLNNEALSIGGRRPEFMTGGEYAYQMNRSWHHRKSEWTDEAISGGVSAAGTAMAMIPGVGWMGGMALDTAFSLTAKRMLGRRSAVRDLGNFTEMADLNQGSGTRRMSAESSAALAERFYNQDTSYLRSVPLIGDWLGERAESKNKNMQVFKQMAQYNLMSDLDPNDIEKIDKRVKQTAEVMDKFAGLMRTTREAIIQIKAKLHAEGMDNSQSNAALGNLAAFTTGTGISLDNALSYRSNFNQMGFQSGYFKTGSENNQGAYGLQGIASIKALRESGLISKMYDAGTLGQQWYGNAVTQSRSSWGRVVERGGGDVGLAREYYEKQGGGNATLGMQFERLSMFGNTNNPLETYRKIQDTTVDKLRASKMSEDKILAYLLQKETTPEGVEQAFAAYSGIDKIGERSAKVGLFNRELERNGLLEKGSTYKVGGIAYAVFKGKLSEISTSGDRSNSYANRSRAEISNMYDEIMTGKGVTREGNSDLYYNYNKYVKRNIVGDANRYWGLRSKEQKEVGYALDAFSDSFETGAASEADRDKIRNLIMEKKIAGTKEQADQVITQNFRDRADNEAIKKALSKDIGSNVDFIMSYGKGRYKLEGEELQQYNKLLGSKTKEEINSIKAQVDAAKSPAEKQAILEKNGMAITSATNIQGETVQTTNMGASQMLLNDAFSGRNNINVDQDKQSLIALRNNYDRILKSSDKSLITDGKRTLTETEYINKFTSSTKNMITLLSDKNNLKKNQGALTESLSMLLSNKEDAAHAANFLVNNPTKVNDFMQRLNEHDFGAMTKAAENMAKGMEPGGDKQTEAIVRFTDVLEKLNKSLG